MFGKLLEKVQKASFRAALQKEISWQCGQQQLDKWLAEMTGHQLESAFDLAYVMFTTFGEIGGAARGLEQAKESFLDSVEKDLGVTLTR